MEKHIKTSINTNTSISTDMNITAKFKDRAVKCKEEAAAEWEEEDIKSSLLFLTFSCKISHLQNPLWVYGVIRGALFKSYVYYLQV